MVETRRLADLESSLLAVSTFPAGDLLVAVSGGADSAGLAYLATRTGQPTRAIHVHHGTEAADRLETAATEVAKTVGIDLEVHEVEMPGGVFSEGKARSIRYDALVEARKPSEWILTGHTRDDQAETVLINLFRGAGRRGLAGIPATTAKGVARPLLRIPRGQLRELAVLASLPFVDDPANVDLSFTRNAIRHSLLPGLEARFNDELTEALARTAELLGRDEEMFESLVDGLPIRLGAEVATIPVGVLATTPAPVVDRALRRMVVAVRPPYGPSLDEIGRLHDVIDGTASKAQLRGGLRAGVEGALLVIAGSPDAALSDRVPLSLGTTRLTGWRLETTWSPGPCLIAPLSPYAAIFPGDSGLTAVLDEGGGLVVEADGRAAWAPGVRRLPVAFYEPGGNGYLSIFAREEREWT